VIRNEVKTITYTVGLHDEPWEIEKAMHCARSDWLDEVDVAEVNCEKLHDLPEGWLKFSSDGTVLVMTLNFDATWKE
jgi:hypothetical protein